MRQRIHLKLPRWTIDNVILLNVRLNERTLIRMILDTGAKYTLTAEDAEDAEFFLFSLRDLRGLGGEFSYR